MSRYRRSDLDLAYGDEPPAAPQRWDRERFERFQRQPEERETFRVTERDRGGRQEILVEDRIERESPRPARRFEERDMFREERFGPPARARRSDRELFGGDDPRDIAERSLAPYRRKSIIEKDMQFKEIARPRPGMIRRQSSLDTFDRRPMRYEREEYRLPPNVPIPLPRRRSPPRRPRYQEEDFEEIRYRDASPFKDDYREMEIVRERSVRRKRSKAKSVKSDVKSVTTARSSSSSSSESFEKVSRASSPASTVRSEKKVGKKGKTRMPKRLVKKQAIIELGYPFEEEEDFIIVRRALGKEQIDEVIRISENYKEPKTTTYRFEETVEAIVEPPPEHYETLRTEWVNPPSVRAPSPARSTRTRRTSPARTVRAPSPPPAPIRETVYIRDPPPPPQAPQQPLTIVLPERRERSDRDLEAEIAALQAEARAVRYEREAPRQEVAIRVREPHHVSHREPHHHSHHDSHHHSHHDAHHVSHPEGYEVVEFRERRPERQEVVEYVERAKSPKREVVRIEKDRKGRMALVRSAH